MMAGVAKQETLIDLSQWADRAGQTLQGMTFEPLWKRLRILLISDMKSNIDGSHSPDGTPFAPLKRARPRGAGKPLYDRGLLLGSLQGGRGHVETMGPTEMTLGTNLEYAAVHQYGATIRPTRGQFLAIPLTPQAVTAGSPRRFGSPLHGLFGGRGGVLKDDAGAIHYALTRQVTIPARPFVGVSPKAQDQIPMFVGDYIEEQVSRSG